MPSGGFFMRHTLQTLRSLLEGMAGLELAGPNQFSHQDAATLAETFRDCRLEVLQNEPCAFSEAKLHRLQQMDYRLQMVASGQGSADGIHSEARRTLEAFGWGTVHDEPK
jgi:hypothetical protein